MVQNIPGRPDESQHHMEEAEHTAMDRPSLASSCCPMCLLAREELKLRLLVYSKLWQILTDLNNFALL